MAISQNNGVVSSVSTASSFSVPLLAGATDTFMVVNFSQDTTNTDVTTSATYNGVALTMAGSQPLRTRDWVGAWYIFNPTPGTHNIVITTSTPVFGAICAATYIGTVTTAVDSVHVDTSDNAGTNALSYGTTTIADNCWAIACSFSTNNGVVFGGSFSPFLSWSGSFAGTGGIEDTNGVVHPAGSVSGTMTNNNSANGVITISIAPFIPTTGRLTATGRLAASGRIATSARLSAGTRPLVP